MTVEEQKVEMTSEEEGTNAETLAPVESVEVEAEVAEEPSDADTEDCEPESSPEDEAPVNPNLHWYVVHTYSGYENRAKAGLEERITQFGLEEFFGEVLIPTENVVELSKGGQKRTSKRKFFPGYMLVLMELTDESWHLVKGTTRITGFVGGTRNPPRVPPGEVARLTKQIDEGTLKPKPLVEFREGEEVRVVDGPFANFNGVVESVNPDKAKVRVMVSIFGRSTPVELEFIQVEKA